MNELTKWIPEEDCKLIKAQDQYWLASVFERFGGYPELNQMWSLMDETWGALGCDPAVMDERIDAYYAHPIWLLNGLFVEQHMQSMDNRKQFADWVVSQSPQRVAEFGGGFGGLARMIGMAIPNTEVEIIEPHPHPIAIARTKRTANVRYRAALRGDYDVMIATDVFEHVPDPLQLVSDTAEHLRIGGQYLIANCFAPLILCHLPQTFHFRHSWDGALQAMGLTPADSVAYGRAFVREAPLNLAAARGEEHRSRKLWRVTQYLPGRIARPLTKLFFLLS